MNKNISRAVSKSFLSLPMLTRYGENMGSCGNYLKFEACSDTAHGKRLVEASFCKNRLCTMCQWRKSLVIRNQVLDLTHWHLEKHEADVPLFLTLTVPSVKGEDLNKLLDEMFRAWGRLIKRKVVDRAVRSWARFLEVTYNKEREDFHPHFHVMLLVPQSYFRKERGLYIPRDEWLKLWQESMRDDRITQVDIRQMKTKGDGALESLVAEVAKYATKPSSYVEKNENGEYEADPQVIEHLHYGLKGRRLVGYGGMFKKIREEKKLIDVEEVDLVDVEDTSDTEENKKEEECQSAKCKICGCEMVKEHYIWNSSKRQYLLKLIDDGFDNSS
jgi:plasmid rolling circle replication initiator protein Rep